MKPELTFYRKLGYLQVGTLGILALALSLSCTSQEGRQGVFDAYALRVSGHADSAGVMLKGITEKHPELAIAWYELSRTILHMGMNNPRNIAGTIDSALQAINMAVEKEPGNALYLSEKGNIESLQFYLALETGDSLAARYLASVEETYNRVLELDPTYLEHKITLVEFYGMLPAEAGGDPEKAERYARELEEADLVAGAKAREIMMPQDADYEAFWKGITEQQPANPDAQQALGRIYLFLGNFVEASSQFQKAMELDPAKNFLYLDLGRYQMMQAMQNASALDSVAPLIREQFNRYLESSPAPLDPVKAWTYGMLSMISRRTGDAEAAGELLDKANALDPFFSRAFGKPGMSLYCPPDKVIHEQSYYMSPF